MKKLSSLLLCSLLCITYLQAQQTWNIGSPTLTDVTATLSGGTLTISGEGEMENYTITSSTPASANTPWWNYRNDIFNVIIDDGVTTIGQSAFYGCSSLAFITIPNTVTIIGAYAFQYCSSLTSISIPKSVTNIEGDGYTFAICENLYEINVDPDNTVYSSINGVHFNKDQTILIAYPRGSKSNHYDIPASVNIIANGAFVFNSSLISVNIPNSVNIVGNHAFALCSNLTTVTIGNSTTVFGATAFWDCSSLSSIIIHNPDPPDLTLSSAVFLGVSQSTCTLKVPINSVSLYKKADVWKDFLVTGICWVSTLTNDAAYGTVSESEYIDENTTATVTATANSGYRFVNWKKDNEVVSTNNPYSFTAIENVELLANFEPETYTITYNLNGGVNHADNPATYTIESPTINLQNPTRTGYTFAGWAEGNNIVSGNTGNKTFTAQWNVINYDIVYVLNGGINHAANPATYTIESATIKLQNPTRTGYAFAGWAEGDYIASGSTDNKTFTAQWNIIINSYSVNVSVNNSSYGSASGCDTYEENTTATVTATANSGYKFMNWTNGNVSVSTTNPYIFTVTEDVSLMANFVCDGTDCDGCEECDPDGVCGECGEYGDNCICAPLIVLLNFDTYVVIKWDNNTFMLNLNRLAADGYTVTSCTWYKNGVPIGKDFSYSAGSKSTDRLETGAVYTFELITSNRGKQHSTDKIINTTILLAYPNPLLSGHMLTIEGVTEGSPIEVYNQRGLLVNRTIATSGVTTLTLHVPVGIYVVHTNKGQIKIVITN